jgi:hypothetical protein
MLAGTLMPTRLDGIDGDELDRMRHAGAASFFQTLANDENPLSEVEGVSTGVVRGVGNIIV